MEKETRIISEDTARSMGNITEDEIRNAKSRADGYIVTIGNIRYYLSIQLDLRTDPKTVEMPDMMGEGRNFKGPASKPRE